MIETGEWLAGATVIGVDTRIDLNDRGQFAFIATLSDGREGIFRADPTLEPTPEPTTLLLFSTTIAGVGLSAWRKLRDAWPCALPDRELGELVRARPGGDPIPAARWLGAD